MGQKTISGEMDKQGYNLVAIVGPTATGKTQLAVALANRLHGEIISADSRQVYRHMDIGTGKDLAEYRVDGVDIPYHLLDIVDPGYKYNVFEYQTDFFKVYQDICSRQVFPIMCGGSGLYIEAVLAGYQLISVPPNPELRKQLSAKSLEELTAILESYKVLHNQTDTETSVRAIRAIEIEEYYRSHDQVDSDLPDLKPLVIGVDITREDRRKRITKRLKERIESGMIEEAQNLLRMGLTEDDLIYYGLEYKYLALYLSGKLSKQEMFEQLNIAIHQFAKRQMTWFRRMERNGTEIHWMSYSEPIEERVDKIVHLLR